jgi:hypothetical protein
MVNSPTLLSSASLSLLVHMGSDKSAQTPPLLSQMTRMKYTGEFDIAVTRSA